MGRTGAHRQRRIAPQPRVGVGRAAAPERAAAPVALHARVRAARAQTHRGIQRAPRGGRSRRRRDLDRGAATAIAQAHVDAAVALRRARARRRRARGARRRRRPPAAAGSACTDTRSGRSAIAKLALARADLEAQPPARVAPQAQRRRATSARRGTRSLSPSSSTKRCCASRPGNTSKTQGSAGACADVLHRRSASGSPSRRARRAECARAARQRAAGAARGRARRRARRTSRPAAGRARARARRARRPGATSSDGPSISWSSTAAASGSSGNS